MCIAPEGQCLLSVNCFWFCGYTMQEIYEIYIEFLFGFKYKMYIGWVRNNKIIAEYKRG